MSATETLVPGSFATSAARSRLDHLLTRHGSHGRPLRVALYSPGMVGLGHMRRHLLIAQALADSPLRPTLLMLAEAREAGSFPMPNHVDCVTLPALHKNPDGRCTPRYIDLPLREVVALRAEIIRATLRSLDPDVLIVDHLPRGALGELQPALAALRAEGRTHCVLGLRDVLEEPDTVRQEWRRWRAAEAIRDYYDAVWIYGDPTVYDLIRECRLPAAVEEKAVYTGYLDSRRRLESEPSHAPHLAEALEVGDRALTLCLVGGGQDGGPLAEAFLKARLPPNMLGVVITGPFMPAESRERIHVLASGRSDMKVLDFISEPAPLLARADRVIAMGGYNSVCDVLAFRKRALIVPRGLPRHEQLIRAERLAALGAFDVLDPSRLEPAALTRWLFNAAPAAAEPRVDLGGLKRLPRLLEAMIARGRASVPLERASVLA